MSSVSAKIRLEPYRIEIKSPSGNVVVADEPVEKGGKDSGLSPKELLAAALSACTSATLRMYIEQKEWDIPEITVETQLTESEGTNFLQKINFAAPISEKQRTILLNVANTCPVHKILAGEIDFETIVS